jgi:HK97 family phage prohead protease
MSALKVEGWAAPYGRLRPDWGLRLAPNALDLDLQERAAVPILLDHDAALELAAVQALSPGPYGLMPFPLHALWFTFRLPPGPVADALEMAVKHRRVTGCSIKLHLGYATREHQLRDGTWCRTITRAALEEVSIVLAPNTPAYPGTSLQVQRIMGSSVGWSCNPSQAARLANRLRGLTSVAA